MKKLSSGCVIEIFIEKINRYIYVKYIDNRDFKDDVVYPFQFRIFTEYFTHTSNSEFDFSDLLISPLHLTGFKELIFNNSWKIIGKQKITDDDICDHHYKMVWPPDLLAMFENVKKWRVIKNINNINEGVIVTYNKCAHLEYAENLEGIYLEFRVYIEFLKEQNRIAELDKSKSAWNKFEQVLFSRYINMPLYKEMPKNHRGKLIP
jgi:hypothetical protein